MYLGISIYTQYINIHVVTIKTWQKYEREIYIYIYEVFEEG